jgi:hypothetical protein
LVGAEITEGRMQTATVIAALEIGKKFRTGDFA